MEIQIFINVRGTLVRRTQRLNDEAVELETRSVAECISHLILGVVDVGGNS